MRLLIASLYDLYLWILVFVLVIDITTSVIGVSHSLSLILMSLLSFIINLDRISAGTGCFCSLPIDLGSLADGFHSDEVVSNDHLTHSFAFYLDSLR